jgi:hypothetical protein
VELHSVMSEGRLGAFQYARRAFWTRRVRAAKRSRARRATPQNNFIISVFSALNFLLHIFPNNFKISRFLSFELQFFDFLINLLIFNLLTKCFGIDFRLLIQLCCFRTQAVFSQQPATLSRYCFFGKLTIAA